MPSPKYFDQVPAFPSSTVVADIPSISLSLLESDNEAEAIKVFDACRRHGFFTLSLDSEQGLELVHDAERMFDLASETLDLDKETLQRFAGNPPKDLLGYKAAGLVKTDDGKFDATEMYAIGQDHMLGLVSPRANPEPIDDRRGECRRFFERAHRIVAIILNALDTQLGLTKGNLVHLCSLQRTSATSLRMLLTRPGNSADRVTLGGHTDIGLITLLFHVAGGLQILPAGSENKDRNWKFIRPKPYCALVNVADTLVEMTGGVLRSALHRVVAAPGDQASVPRVSLAYLVRPAQGQLMTRLRGNGQVIPLTRAEDDETPQTVDQWAAERAVQIMNGVLKPQTNGGAPI